MRATHLSVLLPLVLACGCERTPPEDFPPRASAPGRPAVASFPPTPSEGAGAASRDRCLRPMPAEAPAAVAPGPAPGCPADPEPAAAALPLVRVTFPGGAAVDAEVARSDHDTTRGLMYRTTMAEDHGMLFHLALREDHQFWMHNTCIPLDLLFVDDDGLVVGVVENAPTLDDQPRGVGCPSHYVLEVNAGWTRRHSVHVGERMTIPPQAR